MKENKKNKEVGVKIEGKKFGWFKSRQGKFIILTRYDNDKPVVRKKIENGEVVEVTHYLKRACRKKK